MRAGESEKRLQKKEEMRCEICRWRISERCGENKGCVSQRGYRGKGCEGQDRRDGDIPKTTAFSTDSVTCNSQSHIFRIEIFSKTVTVVTH